MIDDALLSAAAFKGEIAASRKLAQRTGMLEADALRATLVRQAGLAGLDVLLAARAAERLRSEHKAAVRRAHADAALARRRQAPSEPLWRAWFDGSARPNPGRCGIGALLEGPHGVRVELSRSAGYGDSSEAEYLALIALLGAAVQQGASGLAIHGDSQVVIDDVNAPDCAGAPSLQLLRTQARALLARIPGATVRWIPRHKNVHADALSQRAVSLFPPEEAHEPRN